MSQIHHMKIVSFFIVVSLYFWKNGGSTQFCILPLGKSLAKFQIIKQRWENLSLIARALEDSEFGAREFVAMANLDLSAAFNVFNVPLLIKRLFNN